MGVPVVIGGDNLPTPVGIGLTDLSNMGGGGQTGQWPPWPPSSGITAVHNYLINNPKMFNGVTDDLALKPYISQKKLLL